jgi:hypothetical protein
MKHTPHKGTPLKLFLNRKLVIAATAVAMLGGAAVALAATQSSAGSGAKAYIGDLAGRLGVSSSTLTAAIRAADNDRINAAVAAGRLTQTEANALLRRVAQSTGAPLLAGGLGRRAGGARFGRGVADVAAAAAQYLGLSESTLRADLAGGQSLDALADATNDRSAAGLKTAIVNAETAKLDAAVSANEITGTQESRVLTSLSSRLDAILSRTWSGGRAAGAARRGATGANGVSGSGLFGA